MKKYFTLVELSIVLAIIATLATIAVPNVVNYMEKSRDAKRVSDMQVLTLAIESFREDHGHYPDNTDPDMENMTGECIGTRGRLANAGPCSANPAVDQGFDFLVRQYIQGPVPGDPLYANRGDEFFYVYDWDHTVDWPRTIDWDILPPFCDGLANVTDQRAVLGFRRAETNTIERYRDTCTDNDMDLDDADYNIAFPE